MRESLDPPSPSSPSSNPFVYVALTGVSDAAAILIGAPISNKIGRRNTIGLAQCLAGLMTIAVLAVPAGG